MPLTIRLKWSELKLEVLLKLSCSISINETFCAFRVFQDSFWRLETVSVGFLKYYAIMVSDNFKNAFSSILRTANKSKFKNYASWGH